MVDSLFLKLATTLFPVPHVLLQTCLSLSSFQKVGVLNPAKLMIAMTSKPGYLGYVHSWNQDTMLWGSSSSRIERSHAVFQSLPDRWVSEPSDDSSPSCWVTLPTPAPTLPSLGSTHCRAVTSHPSLPFQIPGPQSCDIMKWLFYGTKFEVVLMQQY